VTDDSPQKVWAVKGSDITFVASQETRDRLAKFFPKDKRDSVKAISFPVGTRLTQNLSTSEFDFVVKQLDAKSNALTQIEIPISGAAVQLNYFSKFVENLCREGFEFTIIGQDSMLTKGFFDTVQRFPHVQLSIGKDSWETVNFYESLFYQPNRPSIEMTKPSEQAFKAILNPRQRGGTIMLLTAPIGRQEYDNLNFLIRNGLLATYEEQKKLFKEKDLKEWVDKARHWRAIRIPDDPTEAANFVKRLKQFGIFYAMLSAVVPERSELKDNGVIRIWEEIGKLV
jgi:hypothetical protein